MASFEQIVKFENEKPKGGAPAGGARRPAEPLQNELRLAGDGSPHLDWLAGDGSPYPDRLAGDGSPHPLGELPTRRKLPHGPPPFPVHGPIVQFVTVNAAKRGGMPFLAVAEKILDAARFYHEHGRWYLHLLLVMTDHLHMLANFPSGNGKATCGAWKGFLRKTAGVCFQSDCFEHRIRNEREFAEKWHYICENPVRKGLVDVPDKWPYWIAFDSVTGMQTGGARRPAEPLQNELRLAEDGSPHHNWLAEDGLPHHNWLAGDGLPHHDRLAEDGSPHHLASATL